jgi:thiamine-phosphate pyrophosphorylase
MLEIKHPLYAIYPGPIDGPTDVEAVITSLCEAGVTLIQYREQQLSDGEALAIARRVVQAALPFSVQVLINDRPDIALMSDAAGVHLGQEDLPPAAARALLTQDSIVGVSVDTAEEAIQAEADGVDYISLGPAYPTASKPDVPEPRSLALYERLAGDLSIPLVAIGGITAANVAPLARAGVRAVAVISALYEGKDVRAQAEALTDAFLKAAPSAEENQKGA